MQKALRASSLVPPGFVVIGTENEGRSTAASSQCPNCGMGSRQIHSHYQRRIADLPMAGRSLQLVAYVRRFRCRAVRCRQIIFAGRFAAEILSPWARRTGRLEELVHHLGLALGGRPAASFARRFMLPVNNDTLLRVVRRRGTPAAPPPNIISIDDCAWRRNQRYGTFICDLERRCPIRLLPHREPGTAEAWLAGQPQITAVARDRGGAYARVAAKALPHASQVADRWHLMENASQAFSLQYVDPCGRSAAPSAL